MQDSTLILLFKGDPPTEILLGYKKVGFGHGKYTGFGGKVEPGELINETAVRELAEETGILLQTQSISHHATLIFNFPHKIGWNQQVYVFKAYPEHTYPQESREMIPKWFQINAIPYDLMWDDGRYWLPEILAGKSFCAYFKFAVDNAIVDSVEFTPLNPIIE